MSQRVPVILTMLVTISRKSTPGGALLCGNHLVRPWSSTQSVIALPSGEAAYFAIVRAASVSLGFRSLLADLGWRA